MFNFPGKRNERGGKGKKEKETEMKKKRGTGDRGRYITHRAYVVTIVATQSFEIRCRRIK